MNAYQFDPIGRQLMYNQISIYKNNVPPAFDKNFPILAEAAKQTRIKTAPYNHKAVIKSLDEMEFISFAKSGKWNKGKFFFSYLEICLRYLKIKIYFE